MNNNTAKKLIDLRGDKTRKEVAHDLGISVSALQMYENGERTPRDQVKLKIASYYEVTVEFLFFDQKNHVTCGIEEHAATSA